MRLNEMVFILHKDFPILILALGLLFKLSSDYLRRGQLHFFLCLKLQIDRLRSPFSYFIIRISAMPLCVHGFSLVSQIPGKARDPLKVNMSSTSVLCAPH